MTDASVESVESVKNILEVEGLSYRYPAGQLALNDVCFSVGDGEIVGIVGPSGAGKSTLLMHLNGLLPEKVPSKAKRDPPDQSTVRVAGLPMVRENLREIRRLVGLVFQDPDDQLFCPSVREDVAFGPLNLGLSREEAQRRVTESLEAVGLVDIEDRSTIQLSVGERKRVCLAAVLACRPAILALDEPFSNLDPRARRALTEVLKSFTGSQIVATHDLDLIVELCDRVIVLDEGRIHAEGPPSQILADERLMQEHGLEVPLRIQLGLLADPDDSLS